MFNLSIRSSLPFIAKTFHTSLQTNRLFAFRAQFIPPVSSGPLAMYSTPNRINFFVTKFMDENPDMTKSEINLLEKFLRFIPDFQKSNINPPGFRIICLPQQTILKMLRIPEEKLTPQHIKRTLESLGFEIRKAEFLNQVEMQLKYGGVPLLPIINVHYSICAGGLVNVSSRIQKAKTIEELQSIYRELKNLYSFELFRKGDAPKESVLDFLILGTVQRETYRSLEYYLKNDKFLTQHTHCLSENKECYEQTRPVFYRLLGALAQDPSYFTAKPAIDFRRLWEIIDETENQVDIVKALYKDSLREKFPLKSWDQIAFYIRNRQDLYSDSNRKVEQLWHMLIDPEKAGVRLPPINEKFLQSYVEAAKVYIDYRRNRPNPDGHVSKQWIEDGLDHKIDSVFCYYHARNLTKEQIREVAIYEIKESLRKGEFETRLGNMLFIINSANDRFRH